MRIDLYQHVDCGDIAEKILRRLDVQSEQLGIIHEQIEALASTASPEIIARIQALTAQATANRAALAAAVAANTPPEAT